MKRRLYNKNIDYSKEDAIDGRVEKLGRAVIGQAIKDYKFKRKVFVKKLCNMLNEEEPKIKYRRRAELVELMNQWKGARNFLFPNSYRGSLYFWCEVANMVPDMRKVRDENYDKVASFIDSVLSNN